jgi:hypothetical protein
MAEFSDDGRHQSIDFNPQPTPGDKRSVDPELGYSPFPYAYSRFFDALRAGEQIKISPPEEELEAQRAVLVSVYEEAGFQAEEVLRFPIPDTHPRPPLFPSSVEPLEKSLRPEESLNHSIYIYDEPSLLPKRTIKSEPIPTTKLLGSLFTANVQHETDVRIERESTARLLALIKEHGAGNVVAVPATQELAKRFKGPLPTNLMVVMVRKEATPPAQPK